MNTYIEETRFAALGLFALMGQDDLELDERRRQLASAIDQRRRAWSILHVGAPKSAGGEDTTAYFEHRLRDAQGAAQRAESEIGLLKPLVSAKEASVQALACALLQIAKQGISMVHGKLTISPPGRRIGHETLSNVIWHARNQAMHWEENSFNQAVTACFRNMALEFGSDFHLPRTQPKSLAREVIRCLRWADYDPYEADMVSLLG